MVSVLKSYKLGAYLVQPKHNKLKLNETEFKIEPKIMQVLCFLVQHKQEVLSRTEIAQALWPETVTGPEVVTRAIFELRKVLNDDPKNPIYIETIARKGYCFIFDIAPDAVEGDTKKKLIPAKNHLILLLLLTLGFMFIGSLMYQQDVKKIKMKPSILTNDSFYSDMPAISPMGDQVLFTRKANSTEQYNQLVIMDLSTYQETEITQTDAEYKKPIWSPNSKYWFYIKCKERNLCSIIKHDIASNITEIISSKKHNIFHFSASDNGNYFVLSVMKNSLMQLVLLNINENTKLTLIETRDKLISLPTFNFDNKSFFYVSTVRGGVSTIYQYDILKNDSSEVLSGFSRITGLSLKDEQTMWVSGNIKEKKGIWELDLNSGELLSIYETFPGYTPTLVTSKPGLNSLIFKNFTKNIALHKSDSKTFTIDKNVNSTMIDINGVYASKTNSLYFVSNRNGFYDIWRSRNNEVQKISNIKANMIERPILNLQQNKLATVFRKDLKSEVVVLDLTNNLEIGHINIPKHIFLLSWSNDQKYLYFSKRENGQYNIFKLHVQTGDYKKILVDAGAIMQESKSGGSLYYGDMEHKQLVEKTSSGEVKVIFKLPENERGLAPHRIKLVENGLFYISKQQDKTILKYYSFQDGTLIDYMELPLDAYVTDIVYDGEVSVIYDLFSNMNANLIQLTEIEEGE